MIPNIDHTALDNMPVADLSELPAAVLADFEAALDRDAKRLTKRLAIFEAALDRKYADRATAARMADGKDTGTARIVDGDYIVAADLPKRVKWDQAKLRAAFDQMDQDTAQHYANVKLDVPETKYKAAPPDIRRLLEPARTVITGRPSYTFLPNTAERAA